MYAARLVTRRYLNASKVVAKSQTTSTGIGANKFALTQLSQRNHVYDKRHYTPEYDDYNVAPTARPWDHFTLRANQNRQRRFGQYMLWICAIYVGWGWFRYMVIRQRLNRVEKWDWQCKYWRYVVKYIYSLAKSQKL